MPEEDNQSPASNCEPSDSEARQSGTFPRRRRRGSLCTDSVSQPPSEQMPLQQETIDADDEKSSVPSVAPAPVATGHAGNEKPEQKQQSDSKSATGDKAGDTNGDEEVSPGRRAVRIAMMLVIVAVAGYVVWNMAEESSSTHNLMAQLARGPEAPAKHGTTAGNKLAGDLEQRLRKGDFVQIAKQATTLLAKAPESVKLRRVLLKAQTVLAVTELATKLDQLPKPRLADAATPVPENIVMLQKRIKLLKVLEKHHKDWREALLEVPAAKDVYARFQKEIASAPAALTSLQTGLSFLEQARETLLIKRPNFNKCTELLRTAWGYLRLKTLVRTAADSRHIAKAIYLLDHHVVDQAVEHLKQASDLGRLAATKTGKAKTILKDIRTQLANSWKQAKAKVGAWDDLHTAQLKCREAYRRGNVDQAIGIIAAVLPKADPDNLLTRDLTRKLKALNRHYTTVRIAWQKALKVKQTKTIKKQLTAWAGFQRVLTNDDAYYTVQFRHELLAIKKIIVDRIDQGYTRLQTREVGYKPITLQMRKPQNPRAPFAVAAKQLANMAISAQKVSDTAALVPNWRLGSKTEAKVDYARNILADLNDQARKLNNLYKLYKRLGKREVARECLERVRLLGNSSSNPWYSEAIKILEGR